MHATADSETPVCAPGSPLARALRLCEAAARRSCPVLLQGESGTGKEVAARWVHARSDRARGPFVAVNCGAIAGNLIESELFGHRKGAFTGAAADHPGRFRQAQGGTLFLDEIGDLPLGAQVSLLRALQEKKVSPVGDTLEYPVDFRLVCATHRDLKAMAREGRFREDLLFRLDVVAIALPPLRERPGDVPLLLRRFLADLLPPPEAESAWRSAPPSLARRAFPGNVRELRNLAERFCVYRELGGGWEDALGGALGGPEPGRGADGFPDAAPSSAHPSAHPRAASYGPPSIPSWRIRSSRITDAELAQALVACGHHRGKAAGMLGITRRALQYRLAKWARAAPAAA